MDGYGQNIILFRENNSVLLSNTIIVIFLMPIIYSYQIHLNFKSREFLKFMETSFSTLIDQPVSPLKNETMTPENRNFSFRIGLIFQSHSATPHLMGDCGPRVK